MVYDDLAFCSCFVVTWASVCRRGLSSLPGGLLAGVGAGGELVDLGAGQDDAAAGAGDRADGELAAGDEVPQPRLAQAEQAGDLTDAVRQPLGGECGGHAAGTCSATVLVNSSRSTGRRSALVRPARNRPAASPRMRVYTPVLWRLTVTGWSLARAANFSWLMPASNSSRSSAAPLTCLKVTSFVQPILAPSTAKSQRLAVDGDKARGFVGGGGGSGLDVARAVGEGESGRDLNRPGMTR